MSTYGDYEDKAFLSELYDFVPRYAMRGDIEFYVETCRAGSGDVLELGCGTGRVLGPLAEAGMAITGLDLSDRMLSRCRANVAALSPEAQGRVTLVQGSMTDFSLGRRFATAIIPFRPFQHLVSVADQRACLQCINTHLPVSGHLAFDLFQVDLSKIADPRRLEESEDLAEMELPDGRRMRRCNRFSALHPAEQYNDVEIIYYVTDPGGTTKRLVQEFPFRYFFRYEVEHLLELCGFTVESLYGNFDRTPFTDDSPEMVFIARKVRDL